MLVSLDDLKDHLNIRTSDDDDELLGFLDSAEELVRDEAAVYDAGTYTETLWTDPYAGTALLSHTPVTAVTSVVGGGETITGTTFTSAGILYGVRGWRQVTVTYTAGTAVPSARLQTAVKMVAARLWDSQRGNGPGPLQGEGDAAFTPGLQGIIGEVRALLGRDAGGLGTVA